MTDVDTKTLDRYLQLKSEVFSFPENSDLLTTEVKTAELPWLQQMSIGKIPNWACLLIGGLVVLLVLLSILIGLLVRHMKQRAEIAKMVHSQKVNPLGNETSRDEEKPGENLSNKISDLSSTKLQEF